MTTTLPLRAVRAGLVEYPLAWQEQRRLHGAVADGTEPPTVLLLEHPSVYTAGKRTEPWDRPADGTPVVEVDRGGKITWHGPGQLVGYPIVALAEPVDVIAYVRALEEALIRACAEAGVATTRVEGRSGVWLTGPVPRKNPERQTSAETNPPLPLPAVPLRRSEPKAEPTAPLMIAKLEYGTTQDWNTDPGDVDNLMRHVRSALGLWYGWKPMNVNEVVATYKGKKQLLIPALYVSGHEAFTFSDEQLVLNLQRQVLESALLAGGVAFAVVGIACPEQISQARDFRFPNGWAFICPAAVAGLSGQ